MQHARTAKAFWRLAGAAACAVACTLIGAAGAAFGADAACFEGESMSESSTAIAAVSDANASGRCSTGSNQALTYVQTGEMANKSVSFSSVAEKVEIRVRGADTNGTVTLPKVRVFVDGEDYTLDKVLDQQVTSSYTTLTADLTRSADKAAGTHTIYVKMANGDTGDKIWVDWIAFTYTPADTTPPDTSITDGPAEGSTDTDGKVTFAFSGTDNKAIARYEVKNEKDGVKEPFISNGTSTTKTYTSLTDGSYSFRVRAVDTSGNVSTVAIRNYSVSIPVTETRVNVKDFGATGNGTSNDTAAFESAMANAGAGEVVYVPAPGTYRIANVNIPSDTFVKVQAGAVLKKYGTNAGPLFRAQGPNDTTFAKNIYIEGDRGTFTMDLNDAGADTAAVRFSNVDGFSLKNAVCIQNNGNQEMLPPTSYKPCLSFLSTNTTPTNGIYNAPRNGVLDNVHSKRSPYGFGLTQFNGGYNIRLTNISSEGGVPLRLESFKGSATPMDKIVADGVTCKNGHDALHMNPHGTDHGTITVRNVTVDSCESALSIKKDNTLGGSYASDSSISNVTVIPGNTAQLRDSDPTNDAGSWIIGSSKWCVDTESNLGYKVNLSNMLCGGLPDRVN
jgi:hypothetical protein